MPEKPLHDLDQLGWLEFERLCTILLALVAGVRPQAWSGDADGLRSVVCPDDIQVAGRTLRGPVLVRVAWRHADDHTVVADVGPAAATEPRTRSALLLSNLAPDQIASLRLSVAGVEELWVLGSEQLSRLIDAMPALRLDVPGVLGLRAVEHAADPQVVGRSQFALAQAHELARVFVATQPYMRALDVLARHRFVVLTGPPEMGKTAIARMVALARHSAGWEAHECIRPEQVFAALRADRRQVFIADDAFGSTEYRPDAAERWARDLDRILRAMDDDHWLIWTSRPAPLRAGLRRVHRERGAEGFPSPAEVQVDASDLDETEKALILFRHAKAAGLGAAARELVRLVGTRIVDHPHFTPERIRRFVGAHLDDVAAAADLGMAEGAIERAISVELETPTAAMAGSFAALSPEHRALLVAMLDAPPGGAVSERDLAAALRRHHPGGLSRAPVDLMDRLTDHFLRVLP